MLLAQLNNNYIQKKQKLIQFLRKMIQKVTMYQAVCDGCGRPCAEPYGFTAWATPESASIAAWESGWMTINHELYCPDCVEVDEEMDSYKPKEKKQ